MVPPVGIEPTTRGSSGHRYYRLSYRGMLGFTAFYVIPGLLFIYIPRRILSRRQLIKLERSHPRGFWWERQDSNLRSPKATGLQPAVIATIRLSHMAGGEGFEPSLFGSKPNVLPLNYPPLCGQFGMPSPCIT